jgi:predicted Ser/Thr protein kinase
MRAIEAKLDILDASREDFRRTVVDFVEALAAGGKRFLPTSNERLRRAFEATLKDP